MSRKKISPLGLSAFCESMAMMLSAGIQTDEALMLLVEENTSDGDLTEALRRVHASVEGGMRVSDALSGSGVFPDYLVQMVALGEYQGQMEDVFTHLADYYADQDTISNKIKALIRYPTVMVVVIAAILGVMLWKVLPVFSGVYESMTGSLSSSSYRYVYLAEIICKVVFVVMLLIIAVMLICLVLWKTKGGRKILMKVLENLPASSEIVNCLGLYRFFISLEIYLSAGESQDTAVEESIKVVDCTSVENKLKDCVELMEQGEGIASAAYHVNLLEPLYGRMLLAGARSGDLERVLRRISGLLRDTLGQKVERLVGILDPVLSGVMLITVGFSLISVMLPLIGMMSSIG